MDMQEKDYSAIYNLEGTDIENAEDELRSMFTNVQFVDEKIDDGLDNGDYLMMRSFDVDDAYVKLYYPRSEGTITCVTIN